MSGDKREEDLLASHAETTTAFFGILSGLTFTASVLIFSYRNSLPFGDVFLTLSLATTVLFIFAAALTNEASDALADGRTRDAKRYLDASDGFGGFGFFLMLFEIAFIGFASEWYYGVVLSILILACLYFLLRTVRLFD